MMQSIDVNYFSQPKQCFLNGSMNQMAMLKGIKPICGLNNMDFPSPWMTQLTLLLCAWE